MKFSRLKDKGRRVGQRIYSLISGDGHTHPKCGSRPRMLSVESSSRCNLNCPFCMVGMQNERESTEHTLMERKLGNIDFDLYSKIVQDAVVFGIKTMQLHFQGEPLINRRFPDMVRLAKDHGLYVQAFTNGLLINERYADRIVESGLDLLRFSVDGASEETYQVNRVGGTFKKAYECMKLMVEKARGSDLQLAWQFIVLRNNEHELEKAKQMANELGIPFIAKTFAESVPSLVPRNPEYQRKVHPKPCTDIYRAIFVYWNGDVVPCCYDTEGKEIMGNLTEQSLEEIWESPRYVSLRHRIDYARENPSAEPGICKSCLKWGHVDSSQKGKTSILVSEVYNYPQKLDHVLRWKKGYLSP